MTNTLATTGSTLARPTSLGEYLMNSELYITTINFSNSSVLEILEAYIVGKEKMHPCLRKNYSHLIYTIKGLEKEYNCTLLPWMVNDLFWDNFVSWLYTERGLAMTTIKGLASELRTALEWASRYGAKLSPSYDIVKINATIGEKVALTQDEISHIYHFDLNTVKMRKDKRETLTRVRDAFVLACNIGWRFSDLCRIDPSFFDETHTTMTAVQQKTGDKARVDLQRMTIDKKTTYDILKRYNWHSPVFGMAISNYNGYLRTLTKLIPLEDEIKTEYKALGKIVVKTQKKNEMISSHTARRTYVTINVDRGMRMQDIMRCTGHRSFTSFQKYYIMD